MVTVAIIAILTSIAAPAYLSQQRKNNRTEAIVALTQIQVELERCYGEKGGYSCCESSIGKVLKVQSPTTDNGYYTLTFTPPITDNNCKSVQAYTRTATPLGSQLDDLCLTFSLDSIGNRTATFPTCWSDQ